MRYRLTANQRACHQLIPDAWGMLCAVLSSCTSGTAVGRVICRPPELHQQDCCPVHRKNPSVLRGSALRRTRLHFNMCVLPGLEHRGPTRKTGLLYQPSCGQISMIMSCEIDHHIIRELRVEEGGGGGFAIA